MGVGRKRKGAGRFGPGLPYYAEEGLDLALAVRRALDVGFAEALDGDLLTRCAARCREEAEARARDRAGRTGSVGVCEEEEIHACLYAMLVADPLRWEPGGKVPLPSVVEVNHSPLGYLPGGERNLSRALAHRAGARAGWPDLDIRAVLPGGRPLSWHLELKVEGGRLGSEQARRIGRLRAAGFMVRVTKGLEESVRDVLRVLLGEE